jgi:hypothetical protein
MEIGGGWCGGGAVKEGGLMEGGMMRRRGDVEEGDHGR